MVSAFCTCGLCSHSETKYAVVFSRTNYSLLKAKSQNVMVEWLAVPFHISEVDVSNYPKMDKRTFVIFFSPTLAGIVP
jgi:hypothetical protein